MFYCLAARRAADTITKLLDSADEKVSLRAAENLIEYTEKIIEREMFEERLASL